MNHVTVTEYVSSAVTASFRSVRILEIQLLPDLHIFDSFAALIDITHISRYGAHSTGSYNWLSVILNFGSRQRRSMPSVPYLSEHAISLLAHSSPCRPIFNSIQFNSIYLPTYQGVRASIQQITEHYDMLTGHSARRERTLCENTECPAITLTREEKVKK